MSKNTYYLNPVNLMQLQGDSVMGYKVLRAILHLGSFFVLLIVIIFLLLIKKSHIMMQSNNVLSRKLWLCRN